MLQRTDRSERILFGGQLDHRLSVVIREALVEACGQRWGTIRSVGVSWRSRGNLERDSLDHHGYGNIVVVSGVFALVSISSSDRFKGVVADNLSESLEGNRLNSVELIVGRDS